MQTDRRCPLPLVFLVVFLAAPSPGAGHGQNVTINAGEGPLERCDQLDISFERRPAARDEEQVQVPASRDGLRVNLTRHGGVSLREGTASGHEITLCKAVPEGDAADLAAIRAVVRGSLLEVSGPDRPWVGYLIIRSPRGSRVELSAVNGPIRADEFEGELTVRTVNGPIALSEVRGRVSARAENGPIKLHGGAGQISLETQNGPLGVRLAGAQWQSGELVGRAQNGPVSLAIPAAYGSGVEIESSGHAPWSCRGARGCAEAVTSSGTKRARFGDGAPDVRLSTVNGPVKVMVVKD